MGHIAMLARINLQAEKDTWSSHHIHVPDDATPPTIARELQAQASVTLPTDYQLIANGKEMTPRDTVGALGEFFFHSPNNAIFCRAIDADACREWQRTGRCRLGSKCPNCATHDHHRSPRYVAHTSPNTSPRLPSTPAGNSTTSTTIEAETPSSPPTAKPPTTRSPEHRHNESPCRVCRNWARFGSCDWGERCFFAESHTDANLPQASPTHPSQEALQAAVAAPQQYPAPYMETVLLSSSSSDWPPSGAVQPPATLMYTNNNMFTAGMFDDTMPQEQQLQQKPRKADTWNRYYMQQPLATY